MFLYIICGLLVGFVVGLTGVGGGSLMTPLLSLVFNISPNIAVGTDLAFAALTKGAGVVIHGFKANVHWKAVKLLCMGSIVACLTCIALLKAFSGVSAQAMQIMRYGVIFSVSMTAVALFFRPQLVRFINNHPQYQPQGMTLNVCTVLAGALIGSLVTVSSIGAGAIGATIIILLYPHLSPAKVAGTDIAYAIPLTAIASLGHVWMDNVNYSLLGCLLIGSLPGVMVGSWLCTKLPANFIRFLLIFLLCAVALKMSLA